MSAQGPDPAAIALEVAEFQRRLALSTTTVTRLLPLAPATADRELIAVDGTARLYRYASIAKPCGGPPLLVFFGFVNRPTVLDLQPDRSMIRRLLEAGVDVYLLDWGSPGRADRHRGLADYVAGTLHRAVERVRGRRAAIDLLGVCQGGTLALLYASLEPTRVRRLVTMVTPVDFHTPENLLSKWIRHIDVDALVEVYGNVPGSVLNACFLSLMPYRLTLQKYLTLIDGAEDPGRLENFLRMERWLTDSPDQPGLAFREFVTWFYKENRLLRGGVVLGGRSVDLGAVTMPVLNVYATADHLVPPSASRPLEAAVKSRAYEELAFEGGHIGIYVSHRAATVAAAVARWLVRR